MSNICKWLLCVGLILVAYFCANAQARPKILLKKSWRVIEYGTSDKKYTISDKDTLVIVFFKPIFLKDYLIFSKLNRRKTEIFSEVLSLAFWGSKKDEEGGLFIQTEAMPNEAGLSQDCPELVPAFEQSGLILNGICTVLQAFRIQKEAYKKEGFVILKALESDDYIKMVRFFE